MYPLPEPVFGLSCNDRCPDGTFATVGMESRELECDKCPPNTYSIGGGGIRIDGAMGAFSNRDDDGSALPLRVEQSCQIYSIYSEDSLDRNVDCTPWQRTGSSLKAFEAVTSGVMVDFDLTYPVYFEEAGSVEYKYRKDTVGLSELKLGEFKFFIDGKLQHKDDN